jgi:predicted RNA-binding protein with PUA-like domain
MRTMAYWLFKSEPGSWSWDQQVQAGKAGTEWTGVRNFTAQGNMKKMKKGDEGFFYHSGEGKEIVGIVSVIKDAHPEPGNEDWQCVTLAAAKPVPKPVTLATVKADKKFADMALVKYSRLSVQPVTDAEWKLVSKMGGL